MTPLTVKNGNSEHEIELRLLDSTDFQSSLKKTKNQHVHLRQNRLQITVEQHNHLHRGKNVCLGKHGKHIFKKSR